LSRPLHIPNPWDWASSIRVAKCGVCDIPSCSTSSCSWFIGCAIIVLNSNQPCPNQLSSLTKEPQLDREYCAIASAPLVLFRSPPLSPTPCYHSLTFSASRLTCQCYHSLTFSASRLTCQWLPCFSLSFPALSCSCPALSCSFLALCAVRNTAPAEGSDAVFPLMVPCTEVNGYWSHTYPVAGLRAPRGDLCWVTECCPARYTGHLAARTGRPDFIPCRHDVRWRECKRCQRSHWYV